MTKITFALLSAGCVFIACSGMAAAQPAPTGNSCQASYQEVAREWDAIGFATPAKPLQARVTARDGRVATGAEVTYLGGQLRLVAADCAAGRDEAALQRIAQIQARLTRSAR
jgi:hypothetical protein